MHNDRAQDVFVAANHALDPQCKATIYSKGGYGYGGYSSYNATNGTNGTNATNGSAYGRPVSLPAALAPSSCRDLTRQSLPPPRTEWYHAGRLCGTPSTRLVLL